MTVLANTWNACRSCTNNHMMLPLIKLVHSFAIFDAVLVPLRLHTWAKPAEVLAMLRRSRERFVL